MTRYFRRCAILSTLVRSAYPSLSLSLSLYLSLSFPPLCLSRSISRPRNCAPCKYTPTARHGTTTLPRAHGSNVHRARHDEELRWIFFHPQPPWARETRETSQPDGDQHARCSTFRARPSRSTREWIVAREIRGFRSDVMCARPIPRRDHSPRGEGPRKPRRQ